MDMALKSLIAFHSQQTDISQSQRCIRGLWMPLNERKEEIDQKIALLLLEH